MIARAPHKLASHPLRRPLVRSETHGTPTYVLVLLICRESKASSQLMALRCERSAPGCQWGYALCPLGPSFASYRCGRVDLLVSLLCRDYLVQNAKPGEKGGANELPGRCPTSLAVKCHHLVRSPSSITSSIAGRRPVVLRSASRQACCGVL
ncbi:hypothetical protein IQ07DRAFT_360165 [Pyrenochaeta sp. DS3sAY3a]|nr:hypothetical protein IQ07DRAFT_360165 [Pyrenochaeta sp. DS3sAY3a]